MPYFSAGPPENPTTYALAHNPRLVGTVLLHYAELNPFSTNCGVNARGFHAPSNSLPLRSRISDEYAIRDPRSPDPRSQ